MTGRSLSRAATAAARGNLKALRRILARSPAVLTDRDNDGRTLLDLACRAATCDIAIPLEAGTAEQHAAVDLILAAGADPATADNDGWTPLHTAGMAGHADLALRLVAAGAPVDADAHDKDGGSALSYALFYAKPYMGAVLTPGYPDNLRTAASLGQDLSRFIGAGGELTAAAREGLGFYAPVFFPTLERTLSRQEVLDDLGADPDLRHDFGGEGHGVQAVAMHLAAQHSALKCIDLLLDRGADPAIADARYNATPLEWAEECGAADAAELLRRRA